jgi:DNA-binding transcriptional ArsR family regulator
MSTATTTTAKPKPTKKTTDRAAAFRAVQQTANLLKMASDPTRLQILTTLAKGEVHVGALCETLGQSQPAVSHHLALLRHSGVIAPRREGKNNFYGLTERGEKLSRLATGLIE